MQEENTDILAKETPVPVRPWWQRILALFIIIVLIFLGITTSKYLLETKPKAKKKPPAKELTLVRTARISPSTTPAILHAFGSVIPAQEIQLNSQVSGQVLYLHPNLVPGGIVRKGETLVRLDDRDYQINLKQKKLSQAKAEADFQIEHGNQTVARKEWELINQLNNDIDPSSQDLALRKPQLAKAKNAILAAETDIEKAELDLSRTEIAAPFDAVVKTKNVHIGSQVSSQSPIAGLVGTDFFWAEISISTDKLPWVELPSLSGAGSEVTVYSSSNTPYRGKIVALLPDLDPNGLMARLLIEIKDPLRLRQAKVQTPPLPLGSHIRAEITGKTMHDVYQAPRSAVQDGDKILTVSSEGVLETKQVSILWKSSEWVYIAGGISPETEIIVSNVPAPVEGMPLQIMNGNTNNQKNIGPPDIDKGLIGTEKD